MTLGADTLYLIIGLVIGFLIGCNQKRPIIKKEVIEPSNIIDKLQEELVVYKNLRESLLADVRYWRDKANKK